MAPRARRLEPPNLPTEGGSHPPLLEAVPNPRPNAPKSARGAKRQRPDYPCVGGISSTLRIVSRRYPELPSRRVRTDNCSVVLAALEVLADLAKELSRCLLFLIELEKLRLLLDEGHSGTFDRIMAGAPPGIALYNNVPGDFAYASSSRFHCFIHDSSVSRIVARSASTFG